MARYRTRLWWSARSKVQRLQSGKFRGLQQHLASASEHVSWQQACQCEQVHDNNVPTNSNQISISFARQRVTRATQQVHCYRIRLQVCITQIAILQAATCVIHNNATGQLQAVVAM
jgi:glutamate/tyrosine decarboxylase-like PLP-dependent enzyme